MAFARCFCNRGFMPGELIYGAITALQDAGVPILMQAYPDEIGKMDF